MLLNLLASVMLVASAGAAGFDDVPARPYLDVSPSVLRVDSSVSSVTLSGTTWVLNETLSFDGELHFATVDFESNGSSFSNFRVYGDHLNYDSSADLTVYRSSWVSSDYRTVTFTGEPSSVDSSWFDWLLANAVPEAPSLGEQITDIVGTGLGFVVNLGTALNSGFDAIFMDDGALTNVGSFAFILLGLGISVGIVKKCFNWITGRHGM